MKRFTAILTAAAMLTSIGTLTGCKDKEKKGATLISDDFEGDYSNAVEQYGAMMQQIKSENNENAPIDIEFDNRYVNEEEAILISKYFECLNSNDAELFESLYYDGYLAYNSSLSGMTPSDTLTQFYQSISSKIGTTDYKFDYIIINGVFTPEDGEYGDHYNFESVKNIWDSFADSTDENLKNAINSRKVLSVEALYKTETGDYSLSERYGCDSYLYVYQINGKYYLS